MLGDRRGPRGAAPSSSRPARSSSSPCSASSSCVRRGGSRSGKPSSTAIGSANLCPTSPGRFPAERQDVPDRRGPDPGARAGDRRRPADPGASVLPVPAGRRRVHGLLPWRAPDPGDLRAGVRRAGAATCRGCPKSEFFWAWPRSCSSYSAYVAEVYRAGIESVHPSQVAAARSLGLSRWQALRYVVLPQAVRRVIPPLLNDFISLQKDTALVAIDRGRRGVPAGADRQLRHVQLHAVRGHGAAVRRHHDPAGPVHRPPHRAGPAAATGGATTA